MSGPLEQLLETTAESGATCAERARTALVAEGASLGRWLRRPLLGRTEAALDLAPVAAWTVLVERAQATGRGLTRLGFGQPGGETALARALDYAVGRALARPEELSTALEARQAERHLGHHASRRALASHLADRDAPLPLAALRALGGETERRRVLVRKAVVADGLARGLCRFDDELSAGRLPLSAEDLERQRVAPTDLRRSPTAPELCRAAAEQVVWARELLALAWALPHDLGPRHAPWAGGWLRRIEARLRAVERIDFDLCGRSAEPSPGALDRATLLGAGWWLPPRSVVDHGA